jgi:nicotinate dehydrogenase large molybdopterin subunit
VKTDVVGSPAVRPDAWAKALGQAKFPSDLNREGQLYGVVVRSPYAHALITEIDTSEAEKMLGVVGIFTGEAVPNNHHGVLFRDQPVLAVGRVRMVGEPLAVIVAESEIAARESAEKVEVKYRQLTALFDPEQAMQPGAQAVHPEAHGESNVLYHLPVRKGDMKIGWRKASVVVEREYTTQMVDHAFLQPEAVLAYPDERGHLVIEVATQYAHYDRAEITHALGFKINQVQVKCTCVGGAFGGREDLSLQIIAALAAWKTQRPVKLVNTREESFLSHCKRHPMLMRYKTGATKYGKLVAMEATIIGDAGAYASWSTNILRKAAVHASGPYEIPNLSIDSYAVLTNNPYTGAMRGFGAAQPVFAYESQMELLARELGMSPVEFRLKNILKTGSITATGQILTDSVGLRACIQKLAPYLKAKEGLE